MTDEVQPEFVWRLLDHASENITAEDGTKITALTLLLQAGGEQFAVCVSGPEPLPLKKAVNALRAAQAHSLAIFGIDPTSVMKDARLAKPDELTTAKLNG